MEMISELMMMTSTTATTTTTTTENKTEKNSEDFVDTHNNNNNNNNSIGCSVPIQIKIGCSSSSEETNNEEKKQDKSETSSSVDISTHPTVSLYERLRHATKGSKNAYGYPSFDNLPKERIKYEPYTADCIFAVTEKIDGTNTIVIIDLETENVSVASRNIHLGDLDQFDPSTHFNAKSVLLPLQSKLVELAHRAFKHSTNTIVQIFGELYGRGVIKGTTYSTEKHFRVFDIAIHTGFFPNDTINSQEQQQQDQQIDIVYVPYKELQELCSSLQLEYTQALFTGTFERTIEYSCSQLYEPSLSCFDKINHSKIREGHVIRPLDRPPFFKGRDGLTTDFGLRFKHKAEFDQIKNQKPTPYDGVCKLMTTARLENLLAKNAMLSQWVDMLQEDAISEYAQIDEKTLDEKAKLVRQTKKLATGIVQKYFSKNNTDIVNNKNTTEGCSSSENNNKS